VKRRQIVCGKEKPEAEPSNPDGTRLTGEGLRLVIPDELDAEFAALEKASDEDLARFERDHLSEPYV
jgi:hypothetical protein